jgi:hypothetical protein
MKKAILLAILLVISAATFSQQIKSSPTLTKQDYLQKSKNQKTAAWVLLGGGIAMFAIAAPGNVSFDALGVLVVVGTVATLSSIPLFIASHRNKKKSMSLSFKNETAPQIQKSSFVYRSVPSLTLKISL